jgi:DNA repair photolyase
LVPTTSSRPSILGQDETSSEVLRRELQKPSWTGDYVGLLERQPDCYQPIEGPLQADAWSARGCCANDRNPIGVVTKGPMVVRDKDVLADLSAQAAAAASTSAFRVSTRTVWRTARTRHLHRHCQRLRAVR